MFEFIGGLIPEHQERRLNQVPPCQEDLIDVLLKIQSGEGNLQCPVSVGTIKFLVFDILAGGSETVATVLQWAMAELMRNHAAMSKVQAEVRGAFTGRTKIIEEGLGELTYLQFVIKETLRLHIPGPLFMRECQESCKVMGYDVPRGTKVLLNLWAIARDPKYWDDARDFRGNCFEFMPFGSGRLMCPGMSFGLANVEVALAKLLFYFDWSLPDGVHPRELDMTETLSIIECQDTRPNHWLRCSSELSVCTVYLQALATAPIRARERRPVFERELGAQELASESERGKHKMLESPERSAAAEHTAMTSGAVELPMLTRTNYHEWSLVMQVSLEALGLWKVVETEKVERRDDRMALAAMLRGVPSDLKATLAVKKTAKKLGRQGRRCALGRIASRTPTSSG
ncbi:hypothetical protein U9M48_039285 [Paspalum notatum var. saurae]|uniref:DUF4219 domain-containing protein n=1 Tax=Paspalum notatum var. saurae TaxID=547442 RepID=A0AAQ3XB95_PASNO